MISIGFFRYFRYVLPVTYSNTFVHTFIRECNICHFFLSAIFDSHSPNSDYRISSWIWSTSAINIYFYVSRWIARDRDYYISIRTEPIAFYVCLIDSIHSGRIVLLFFLYVPYKRRYFDAKFESETFNIKLCRRHRRRYGIGEMSFWNIWRKRQMWR